MTTDELERELADDLKEDARENIAMEGADDDEKRDKSMENIAHSIAKAIKNGEVSLKKATPKELNELADKDELVLWLVDGNGVLAGQPPLSVTDKDIVRWDTTRWTLFAKGGSDPSPTPTIDAYTKAETDARIAESVGAEATRAQTVEASLALAIRNSRVDVSGKADKVAGATNGHLAGLDSTGNLTDSGYKPSDFATAAALASEVAARENADATLQRNIDAEVNARESADDALDARIDSEATEREEDDRDLQAQIDAISSRSDVVDVVASYAELVAYDTSTLADNDVIKVLADETHEDAIAYYRWSTTTEAWSFIGSQGPYYTISETDTLLAGKAPTNHASTATTYGTGDATHYGHVKVDSALSDTSTNPVQNKVVAESIHARALDTDVVHKSEAKETSWGENIITQNFIKGSSNCVIDATEKTVRFDVLTAGGQDSFCTFVVKGSFERGKKYTCSFDVVDLQLSGTWQWSFFRQGKANITISSVGHYSVTFESSENINVNATLMDDNTRSSLAIGDYIVFKNIKYEEGEIETAFSLSHYERAVNMADKAEKLNTARNLKVNLASESSQSFDGSANAESIGVSGTLPIAHGGTGATTAAAARTNLGLGNVENESVSNGTPDFTEASTRTNIASGEKMSILFGKIKKWFTDLKTVAFTGSYNDLVDKPAIPAGQVQSDWNETGTSEPSFIKNKPQNLVQDASYVHTDNNYSTSEKNKLAGIETGAQVNNIFVAVYIGAHNNAGNTPYADINAAYQDGKRLLCWNSASNALRLYTLNGFSATDKIFKFTSCGGGGEDILEVSFAYLEGNINNTECRTNNYLLAKRNHASSDTTYGTGSSSNYGHVKLSASTSSTSGVNDGVAATPSAVKAAYDLANDKYSKPSGGVPYSDMSSGVKASLDKADTALQQQDISGKLDKTGDGKDVTVTFTEAPTRTDVSSGDTLATLFGKVKKWFSSLGSLAFKSSVADGDISGAISDAHIASASTWNGKADKSHASTTTAYGTGTSSNYGHVKLSDDTNSSSGASDGVAATPLAVQNAYKRIGYAYDAYFAQDSTAVGVELLQLNVVSNNTTGSFLVRISNRNPASGKYGEIVALLSIAQRSGNLHLSFMSLVPRGFNGTVMKTSPFRTPNTYDWRIGYRRYTDGTTTDIYSIYLWAVDQTSSANPVMIPFNEIRLTPLDHPNDSYLVRLSSISSAPTIDDYWNLTYPVTNRRSSGMGSSDRPVFMSPYGDVEQCSFMVNRGSHSTVTMDFTGTLGSDANTWYLT